MPERRPEQSSAEVMETQPVPSPVVSPPEATVSVSPALAPIPDAQAQETAEKLLRETFAGELGKAKTSEQKAALAEKFLRQAGSASGNPVDSYVLLRHAADLAAEAGECELMLRAVGELAERYTVDVWKMKADLVSRLLESPKPAKSKAPLVRSCLMEVDEAIAVEAYEAADRMLDNVLTGARKVRDADLTKTVADRRKELDLFRKGYQAATEASKKLAETPNDPAANATRGKYLVAMRHDWSEGLPHLAKGDDAALAGVAATDLTSPSDSDKQVKLADAWCKVAEQGHSLMKGPCEARAVWWYQKAIAELSGVTRARVEKRLKGIKLDADDVIPPDIGIPNPDAVPVGEVRKYGFQGGLTQIAVAPDGRTFMASNWGGNVFWWNLASGDVLMQTKSGEVNYGVAIAPDGRTAVWGGQDKVLHVYDLQAKKEKEGIPMKNLSFLFGCVFFRDSNRLAVGSDGSARLVDLSARRELLRFQGSMGWEDGICLSRDERFIMTSSTDMAIRVMEVATGRPLLTLKGHTGYPRCVACSPNGRLGLSGAEDKTARLWDLSSGRELHRLDGHEGPVWGVAFTDNGRYALSSGGGSLRLWNAATGEAIACFRPGRTAYLALLPDNRFVLCGSVGTVRLWRLPLTKTGRAFKGVYERRPARNTQP
jgi:hypothetical protein